MSKFSEKVIEIVKMVPAGKVVSYGQVSLMAGIPRAAIAVGSILHENGNNTPWWRVISSSGRISTSCEEHTAWMQKDLLEREGVQVKKHLKIDIEKYRFRPDPSLLKSLELDDRYIEEVTQKYFSNHS